MYIVRAQLLKLKQFKSLRDTGVDEQPQGGEGLLVPLHHDCRLLPRISTWPQPALLVGREGEESSTDQIEILFHSQEVISGPKMDMCPTKILKFFLKKVIYEEVQK